MVVGLIQCERSPYGWPLHAFFSPLSDFLGTRRRSRMHWQRSLLHAPSCMLVSSTAQDPHLSFSSYALRSRSRWKTSAPSRVFLLDITISQSTLVFRALVAFRSSSDPCGSARDTFHGSSPQSCSMAPIDGSIDH